VLLAKSSGWWTENDFLLLADPEHVERLRVNHAEGPLQTFVECLRDRKGALVQNRTQSAHIRGCKLLDGFLGGLATRRVCFQRQYHTITQTTQDDGVVAGIQGRRIDQNIIECHAQLCQP
jgi:hypothetical protein